MNTTIIPAVCAAYSPQNDGNLHADCYTNLVANLQVWRADSKVAACRDEARPVGAGGFTGFQLVRISTIIRIAIKIKMFPVWGHFKRIWFWRNCLYWDIPSRREVVVPLAR
ncbi:hypothetical protein N8I77_002046 [Diaporthe amygdali]|uniref:Uncharacterized protein n=1 Tax=Phomopsis amygdali TaxID=1214568 RepID=A0AAD9SS50_PHOAM|nr:hypothetical protein N8I77_002046 [Diaporthe amygdali]